MMEAVNDIMRSVLTFDACNGSGVVAGRNSLCWPFFSPQGGEFRDGNNSPVTGMFRGMGDHVRPCGVHLDTGRMEASNPGNIALIGDTEGMITIDDTKRVHKVILMLEGGVKIKASSFAVILMVNMGGCELVVDKDNTVVVL